LKRKILQILGLIILTAFVLRVSVVVMAKETTVTKVKLKDASVIIGQLLDESLPVKTKYGAMQIDIKGIISIIGKEIKFRDGSILKGEIMKKKVRIKPPWYETLEIPVNYIDSIFFITPSKSKFLSSWKYRKKITIIGQPGAGTNYQVLLKIGESSGVSGADFHLEGHSADFPSRRNQSGDLRFTASDGTTLLDFWVEKVEGTSPNRIVYVWVEVAADLGTNQDIYCYYGNSAATNVSNGDNTFIFFDDFETFDTNKWSRTDSVDVYVNNGIMEIHQNVTDKKTWLRSKIDLPNNLAVESRMKVHAANTYYTGSLRVTNASFSNIYTGVEYNYYSYKGCQAHNYNSFYPLPCTIGVKLSPFWDSEWFRESLRYKGDAGSIKLVRNNGGEDEAITHTGPLCNESTRLYFSPYGWYTGHYIYIDWIAVHKYTFPEPKFGSAGNEEQNISSM